MMIGEIMNDCDYVPSLILPPLWAGQGWADMDISGIAYDSRNVKDGYLFVAIKGEKFDGHNFIKDAIKKGASVIVAERAESEMEARYILVKDSRKALACIANNFYKRPSESLTLIGITGTNGKTTTTYILKSILELQGENVGLIGTIRYMIKDRIYPALHTTPESPEFQSLLRDMFTAGCTYVISEVSSHALAQYRVDRAVFDTAVFTNLTRDHLDFHKTMEDYFMAKKRLFMELLDKGGTAVINLDDSYGKRLIFELRTRDIGQNILTYGLETGADILASDIENSFQGLHFKISFEDKNYDISSSLMGIPNVYNILSAVGVAISLNLPWEAILEGIEKTAPVSGRFEKVDAGQEFLCIFDYAHTEDALERLILTARELISPLHPPLAKEGNRGGTNFKLQAPNSLSRIITVFGCGGDRDRGKRPNMGEVATKLSDFVVITSDNPRFEEPLDIIKDIEEGVAGKNYLIEPDRRKAIRKAVDMADNGDIVLIAGKGHEDYQEIKGVRYPFSDREVLEKVITDKLKIHDAQ